MRQHVREEASTLNPHPSTPGLIVAGVLLWARNHIRKQKVHASEASAEPGGAAAAADLPVPMGGDVSMDAPSGADQTHPWWHLAGHLGARTARRKRMRRQEYGGEAATDTEEESGSDEDMAMRSDPLQARAVL